MIEDQKLCTVSGTFLSWKHHCGFFFQAALVKRVICLGIQESFNRHESCSSNPHPQTKSNTGSWKDTRQVNPEQRDVFVGETMLRSWLVGFVLPEFFLHTPQRKLIWTIKQLAAVPSSASIFLFCLTEFVYTSAPGSCLPILVLQCQ